MVVVEVSLNKGCGEQKLGVKLYITLFVCFVLSCIYWCLLLLLLLTISRFTGVKIFCFLTVAGQRYMKCVSMGGRSTVI